MVSIEASQLCCGSTKAPVDNMYTDEHRCFPIKLYLKKQEAY
jgi:hypothetical protein